VLSGEAENANCIVFALGRLGMHLRTTSLEVNTLPIRPQMRFLRFINLINMHKCIYLVCICSYNASYITVSVE
jgi:hypothetical protein